MPCKVEPSAFPRRAPSLSTPTLTLPRPCKYIGITHALPARGESSRGGRGARPVVSRKVVGQSYKGQGVLVGAVMPDGRCCCTAGPFIVFCPLSFGHKRQRQAHPLHTGSVDAAHTQSYFCVTYCSVWRNGYLLFCWAKRVPPLGFHCNVRRHDAPRRTSPLLFVFPRAASA